MFEHRQLLVREQHSDLQQPFAISSDAHPGDHRSQRPSAGGDDDPEHGNVERDESLSFARTLSVYRQYSRILNVLIAEAPFTSCEGGQTEGRAGLRAVLKKIERKERKEREASWADFWRCSTKTLKSTNY